MIRYWVNRARLFVFSVANGIWSGIPLCCIRYFATFDGRYCGEESKIRRGSSNYVGYVQCDACHESGAYKKIRKNGTILDWLISVEIVNGD